MTAGATYTPGAWLALVSSSSAVMIDPALPGDCLELLWRAVRDGSGVNAMLDAIGQWQPASAPTFALASLDGNAVHVVASGEVQVTAQLADGGERHIAGASRREDSLTIEDTLWLVRPGDRADGVGLPVGLGVVLADVIAWRAGVATRRTLLPRSERIPVGAGAGRRSAGLGSHPRRRYGAGDWSASPHLAAEPERVPGIGIDTAVPEITLPRVRRPAPPQQAPAAAAVEHAAWPEPQPAAVQVPAPAEAVPFDPSADALSAFEPAPVAEAPVLPVRPVGAGLPESSMFQPAAVESTPFQAFTPEPLSPEPLSGVGSPEHRPSDHRVPGAAPLEPQGTDSVAPERFSVDSSPELIAPERVVPDSGVRRPSPFGSVPPHPLSADPVPFGTGSFFEPRRSPSGFEEPALEEPAPDVREHAAGLDASTPVPSPAPAGPAQPIVPIEPVRPAAAHPAVAQPAVLQPVVPQPAVSQPAVSQPAVPQPVSPAPMTRAAARAAAAAAAGAEQAATRVPADPTPSGAVRGGGAGGSRDGRAAGVLVFADGHQVIVDGPVIIGRSPSQTDADRPARLVTVKGEGRGVSRNHLRIDVGGNGAFAVDLGSRNGSMMSPPDGERVIMSAWTPYALVPGTRLTVADLTCEFRPV